VYFAIPGRLVSPGSALDDEARTRGVSLPLPDQALPLLPDSLAQAVCLREGVVQPALSVELRLGADLEPSGCRLVLRRIRPRRILTPEEVIQAQDDDGVAKRLHGLARALRRRRLERGGILLAPLPRLTVGDGPAACRPHPVSADPDALEELGLLASEASGELCASRGIPAIYRVQEAPGERPVDGDATDPAATHEQIRRMPRTFLQVEPGIHAGLGLPVSAAMDRPLDSYADLVMQQQLVEVAARGQTRYAAPELRRVVADTAAAREAGAHVVRSARRYWALRYLENREGKDLEVTVVERAGVGYVVQFTDVGTKGYVRTAGELWANPGDRVRVRVERVCARSDILRLATVMPALRPEESATATAPG